MELTKIQFRRMASFLIVLLFLYLINFFGDQTSSWDGLSAIVRVYLFVFSFYLVFNYSTIDLAKELIRFEQMYPRAGKFLLFLESRALPFIAILFFNWFFLLINKAGQPHWFTVGTLEFMNGRYSNMMFYSLIFLLVLNLRTKPNITIPLFMGLCVLFFFVDKGVYSYFQNGVAIGLFKYLKVIGFIFLLAWEYPYFNSVKKASLISLSAGTLIFVLTLFYFQLIFSASKELPIRNRVAMIMLKLGYSYPNQLLQKEISGSLDQSLVSELITSNLVENQAIDLGKAEWSKLLVKNDFHSAELISKYLLNKNITELDYKMLVGFAEKISATDGESLVKGDSFRHLVEKNIAGEEKDFLKRVKNGNRAFKLWGITILGFHRNVNGMPLLISYLADIDVTISETAYQALVTQTDLDPARKNGWHINDVRVLSEFNKFYLNNRNKPLQDR